MLIIPAIFPNASLLVLSIAAQQKINCPLFLVFVFPICRLSWAGSRKWWFMTRTPKRQGICPKMASYTFSWESWRAPSTKSPCSLVMCSLFLLAWFMLYVYVVYVYFQFSTASPPAPTPHHPHLIVQCGCYSTVWSADVSDELKLSFSPVMSHQSFHIS